MPDRTGQGQNTIHCRRRDFTLDGLSSDDRCSYGHSIRGYNPGFAPGYSGHMFIFTANAIANGTHQPMGSSANGSSAWRGPSSSPPPNLRPTGHTSTTSGRRGGQRREEEGGQTEYFRCRLHSEEDHKPEGGGKRVRERQKPSNTAIGCPVSMRVVRHRGSVTVDCRPSVFRVLAARDVANGYAVAEVAKNICAVNCSEDRKKLFAARGKWLTAKDVHNACTAWKKQNPASQQRGQQ
ncbi:MAG: hypothetical protein FRX48_07466 [Lasallia pustulata]|uniref:Uncharacterized protein n=1 Tax=Lasallia pustulata TaxID=136370 RepID=A0A5M8PKJ3_9LECA|nr:MAG: hypothetical protein FRX48_07466 [Lasallia pustulata]